VSIQKSRDKAEYKWINIFEGLGELNVVYHPKYKRFQMDIHNVDHPVDKSSVSNGSSGNQEQIQPNLLSQSNILDVCEDLEVMMKQRKKYSFVLNYGMSSTHLRQDS